MVQSDHVTVISSYPNWLYPFIRQVLEEKRTRNACLSITIKTHPLICLGYKSLQSSYWIIHISLNRCVKSIKCLDEWNPLERIRQGGRGGAAPAADRRGGSARDRRLREADRDVLPPPASERCPSPTPRTLRQTAAADAATALDVHVFHWSNSSLLIQSYLFSTLSFFTFSKSTGECQADTLLDYWTNVSNRILNDEIVINESTYHMWYWHNPPIGRSRDLLTWLNDNQHLTDHGSPKF